MDKTPDVKHLIDCDANPYIREGWKIVEHWKGGLLKWPLPIELHLSEGQKDGKFISGFRLRGEMSKKLALNACVLDYLFEHSHLIPEKWKRGRIRRIFFWGTIYRHKGGWPCIRYLHWDRERWCCGHQSLRDDWSDRDPAIVLKS